MAAEGAATAGTLGMAAATAELGNSGHEGGGSRSFRARWEGENMKWYAGQPPSPVFIRTAW